MDLLFGYNSKSRASEPQQSSYYSVYQRKKRPGVIGEKSQQFCVYDWLEKKQTGYYDIAKVSEN